MADLGKAVAPIPTYNEPINVEGLVKAIFRSVPDIHILFIADAG